MLAVPKMPQRNNDSSIGLAPNQTTLGREGKTGWLLERIKLLLPNSSLPHN